MKKNIFILTGLTLLLALGSCSSKDSGYDNYNPPPGGNGTGEHTKTITTSGMSFSPATLNATVGDTIRFVVGSSHTATRVSEATWSANGSTSSRGFDFSEGTHTYILLASDVGTVYYVCVPHASMGMKGKIIVAAASN